jgi:hypothetical protein
VKYLENSGKDLRILSKKVYSIFNPVETTVRKGLRYKGEK